MENGHSAPAVESLENFARATYLGRPNQPYCHVTVTFWGAYRTSLTMLAPSNTFLGKRLLELKRVLVFRLSSVSSCSTLTTTAVVI